MSEVCAAVCVCVWLLKRKEMDMSVCLVLASILGIHTTVTRAVQRAAEFLLIKISIMETGEQSRAEETRGNESRGHQLQFNMMQIICHKI